MSKQRKTVYIDIAKMREWEDWCKKTGRVLSKVIEIAVDEFKEKNN